MEDELLSKSFMFTGVIGTCVWDPWLRSSGISVLQGGIINAEKREINDITPGSAIEQSCLPNVDLIL